MYDVWFPLMYKTGISYQDFGKLTMRRMNIIAKAYSEKLEDDFKIADVVAFVQGRYIVEALLCTVGNMLGGKNTKFSYPEKPYSLVKQEEQLTEDEIEKQRQQFIAALQTMQHNFEINKEKEKVATERGS